MRIQAKQIVAIIAIGIVLAYMGMAATRPMGNYAPLPANLIVVILTSVLCGALLVCVTDNALLSIVVAVVLALFLFGGIRAGVVAMNLSEMQISFTLLELAGADSVLQYTISNALLLYLAAGLMGVLGAGVGLWVIPDEWHAGAE